MDTTPMNAIPKDRTQHHEADTAALPARAEGGISKEEVLQLFQPTGELMSQAPWRDLPKIFAIGVCWKKKPRRSRRPPRR